MAELVKNCSESRMMLDKVKEMNAELEKECHTLQK
jgi:hypothetical protein